MFPIFLRAEKDGKEMPGESPPKRSIEIRKDGTGRILCDPTDFFKQRSEPRVILSILPYENRLALVA